MIQSVCGITLAYGKFPMNLYAVGFGVYSTDCTVSTTILDKLVAPSIANSTIL
jgi:hypothetical protein